MTSAHRPERRSAWQHLPWYGSSLLSTALRARPLTRAHCASADILKEKWSPALSVSTILVSLQSLLGGKSEWSLDPALRDCSDRKLSLRLLIEPNNASPLNVEASELWDDVEAVSLRARLRSFALSRDILADTPYPPSQYKVELAKHYRPLEDDE